MIPCAIRYLTGLPRNVRVHYRQRRRPGFDQVLVISAAANLRYSIQPVRSCLSSATIRPADRPRRLAVVPECDLAGTLRIPVQSSVGISCATSSNSRGTSLSTVAPLHSSLGSPSGRAVSQENGLTMPSPAHLPSSILHRRHSKRGGGVSPQRPHGTGRKPLGLILLSPDTSRSRQQEPVSAHWLPKPRVDRPVRAGYLSAGIYPPCCPEIEGMSEAAGIPTIVSEVVTFIQMLPTGTLR
jgi:hypothetical protein